MTSSFPQTSYAQEIDQENAVTLPADYEAWEKVATRAEAALVSNKASERALEELREEVVEWRRVFLSAQGENANRIPTLQAQIAALGPPPGEGETETEDIAQQRVNLENQLATLMEPEIRAREAHSRADGIVREIDTLVRARRVDNLFTRAQTPLDPQLWPEALADFGQSFELATKEFNASLRSQTKQSVFRKNIVSVIGLFLVAALLILKGRKWFEHLTHRLSNRKEEAFLRLLTFLVSTGQIIVPFVGILAFCAALDLTGMLGFRGSILADALPYIALVWLATRWLNSFLFPVDEDRQPAFELSDQHIAILRRNTSVLAILWGLVVAITSIADFDLHSSETRGVLLLPINILAGILTYQLGKTLTYVKVFGNVDETSDAGYQERVARILGRILIAVSVLGPLLAILGYQAAGTSLLFRMLLTMWFFGVLIPIFSVVRDVYSLITRTDEQHAREALIPVLICVLLVLMLVPIFALIWGARVSDLTEIWSRLGEGFLIGETRISLNQFLLFGGVFGIGFLITRLVQSTLKGTVLPKTGIDTGGQVAIVSGLGYVGIFLATLVAISTAGIDLSSLAIVAGALSVGIGFGLQTIVSNFVSGIILLIERPISEGDWIEVGPNMGTVRDISVRSTRIETFDRTDVIIPNSDLISGTVTNYTRGNLIGRVVMGVGVAYGTDTRKVQTILEEIASAQPLVSMNPPPTVIFKGFGADSLDFEIRAILRDVNFKLVLQSEINHQIAERFAQEGIEIPFAQRDIWLRNPEALHASSADKDE
ncbi:MAG: DUF3772 domain-containing protein [Marinosulfonomonas sp.]